MATATLTTTRTRKKTKKARAEDPLATLKPLYPPAARAFLRREVGLTQNLIDAAFLILNAQPPNTSNDPFAVLRRKWDLLRITLETTLYSSSTGENPIDTLPANLRSNLTLSPSELIQTLHTRSIRLHSPKSTPDTPLSPLFLPVQILMALVFASLKLDCPEIGRNIVEQWLSYRADAPSVLNVPLYDGGATPASDPTEDMYERLIEVYCLQILPRLGEWDYAMEFLKYEPELSPERKKHIYTSLKTLHTQATNPPPTTPVRSSSVNGNASGMRAVSPASSISSASTHTAVPATPRPQNISRLSSASLSTSSISSSTSEQTITPNDIPRAAVLNGNGTEQHLSSNQSNLRSRKDSSRSPHPQGRDLRDGDRDSNNSAGGSSHTAFPRPPLAPPLADLTTVSNGAPISAARPTLFETLRFYAQNLGLRRPLSSRVVVPLVLVLLSVVLPVVAYVVRLRRAGRRGARANTAKRIGGAMATAGLGRASQAGIARWLFNAVKDTVIMAGKGLV